MKFYIRPHKQTLVKEAYTIIWQQIIQIYLFSDCPFAFNLGNLFLLCFQTTDFFHASIYVHSTSSPNCAFKLGAAASYDTDDCPFFFNAAATIDGSVSGRFFVSNFLLVALRKIVRCAWPTENAIEMFPGKR